MEKRRLFVDILIAIVMWGILLVGYKGSVVYKLRNDIARTQHELAQLDQAIRGMSPKLNEIERLKQEYTHIQTKLNDIEWLKNQQQAVVHILDELSHALGEEMWLEKFEQIDAAIFLQGRTLSAPAVANFIRQLQDSPYFGDIEVLPTTPLQNPRPFSFFIHLPAFAPFHSKELLDATPDIASQEQQPLLCQDVSRACKTILEVRLREQQYIFQKLTRYTAQHDDCVRLVTQTRIDLETMLQSFPDAHDTEPMFAEIRAEILQHGFQILSFYPLASLKREWCTEVPIQFEVGGQYHSFAKIAEIISSMKYIMTVRDILMVYDKENDQLKIVGILRTFTRHKEEEIAR